MLPTNIIFVYFFIRAHRHRFLEAKQFREILNLSNRWPVKTIETAPNISMNFFNNNKINLIFRSYSWFICFNIGFYFKYEKNDGTEERWKKRRHHENRSSSSSDKRKSSSLSEALCRHHRRTWITASIYRILLNHHFTVIYLSEVLFISYQNVNTASCQNNAHEINIFNKFRTSFK